MRKNMQVTQVSDAIYKYKIITILRGVPEEKILPVTQALYDGGIRIIEVTFNQNSTNCLEETGRAIAIISENFQNRMFVGAGTVITEQQVVTAKDSGAQFIVSPNFDAKIVLKTLETNMVSIPGAYTPSEIIAAHKLGANFIKIFPCGENGVKYIKAIRAPINNIPLLVVGGVNSKTLMEFISAGVVGVGVGSNIADKDLIANSNYDKLSLLAKEYTSQLQV
jgi:2-dehydro-3-deoxyphosphogluconate aldolase/(4S)-4-hydroxy-2-oxoglutarate aldolase